MEHPHVTDAAAALLHGKHIAVCSATPQQGFSFLLRVHVYMAQELDERSSISRQSTSLRHDEGRLVVVTRREQVQGLQIDGYLDLGGSFDLVRECYMRVETKFSKLRVTTSTQPIKNMYAVNGVLHINSSGGTGRSYIMLEENEDPKFTIEPYKTSEPAIMVPLLIMFGVFILAAVINALIAIYF